MTTEGQGRAGDPVGLGIPVVIDGPWAEPRIYPDMAGILDNPDAAYAKLKEMGKGLFGPGGALGGLIGGSPTDRVAAGCPTSWAASSARPWAICCSRAWARAAVWPRHDGLGPTPSAPAPRRRRSAAAAAGQSANERRAEAAVQSVSWIALITSSPVG